VVQAKETNLEGILEGKKQYQVPLYQRVYSWGEKQLRQLWDDLVEIAEVRQRDPNATHFIGSLVLAASPGYGPVGVQTFLVVDGQQRLTTLTLLLAALRDHQAAVDGAHHRDRLDQQFLVNKWEAGEPAKLVPTQADRTPFLAVIRGSADAGGSDAIGAAYRFFRVRLASHDDPDDVDDVRLLEEAVLRGLAVVAVTAQPGDNAHRIFESLNNTGLRLTQADLLKNYLFMRLGDRAESVYGAVWLPLEQKLTSENLELLFWLDLVQDDERVKQADTYTGQQRRLDQMTADEIEEEVRRIAALGNILATILEPDREDDVEVRRRLQRIRAWGTTTAYPAVMQVMLRRAEGTATRDETINALLCLESYFVRRIVTGRATKSLNRTLLQAAGAIKSASQVDTALRTFLSVGRKYFATDAQVRDAVHTVQFYWQGRAAQKKLILFWLEESYGAKERVSESGLTIEHVLPQTLTDEWSADFASTVGPGKDVRYEYEAVVHTLGNLTLTGYNSELSNRPFSEKRVLLNESGLWMNRPIAEQKVWGVSEISARATELAERIIALWPGPDEAAIETQRTGTEGLWEAVAGIVAAIPAGRWTSYGEVAIVAGTHPNPLGQRLASHPVENAHRVLQVAGRVAPGFAWIEPDRTEDPRAVLEREGVRFDEHGRADATQFLPAQELARLAGYDVASDPFDRFAQQVVDLWGGTVADAVGFISDRWEAAGGWFQLGPGSSPTLYFMAGPDTASHIWPIAMYPNGYCEVVFQYLKTRPPFDDPDLREELRARLNEAPGVDLPDRPRPSIRLEALADPEVRDTVVKALDWFADTVRDREVE